MVALRMAPRLRFAQGSERPTALFADLRLVGSGGSRALLALSRTREFYLPLRNALSPWPTMASAKAPKALALGVLR